MSGPIWKMPESSAPIDADQPLDLVPIGDAAGDRRVVRRHMRRRARGREAERAGADRLGDRLLHAAQIVLGRLLLERAPAHRVHAQGRMADIHAVIEALRQALDIGEVFGKGLPGPVDAGQHRLGRDILDRGQAACVPLAVLGLAGCERKAAIPHNDAGDPVPARAAAEPVPGDLRVHMGVPVDKTGRHDQPVSIDDALGGRSDAADLDDAAGLDTDIGLKARQPRSVHHGAVFD